MIMVNCESLNMADGFDVRDKIERREGIYIDLAI